MNRTRATLFLILSLTSCAEVAGDWDKVISVHGYSKGLNAPGTVTLYGDGHCLWRAGVAESYWKDCHEIPGGITSARATSFNGKNLFVVNGEATYNQ